MPTLASDLLRLLNHSTRYLTVPLFCRDVSQILYILMLHCHKTSNCFGPRNVEGYCIYFHHSNSNARTLEKILVCTLHQLGFH